MSETNKNNTKLKARCESESKVDQENLQEAKNQSQNSPTREEEPSLELIELASNSLPSETTTLSSVISSASADSNISINSQAEKLQPGKQEKVEEEQGNQKENCCRKYGLQILFGWIIIFLFFSGLYLVVSEVKAYRARNTGI